MNFYSTLRKYHKWPALVFTSFFLLFAISGVLMNHRQTIAHIDINRKYLPKNYQLKNWNLASVKGARTINSDSIILYGGVGIWLTKSNFENWKPLMDGIPEGSDYRKIFDLEVTPNGILAATRFGLYWLGIGANHWVKLHLPQTDEFCTSIEVVESNIYITTRNSIYHTSAQTLQFTPIDLKAPLGSKKEISTFRLFWNIHSGEIFGITGRLLADLVALVMIFLSITGIIYFLAPKIIKRYHEQFRFHKLKRTTRFSYRWHLNVGALATLLLVISGLTGTFLRPPFLLTIANSQIVLNNQKVSNSYYWND
ncbi:MAG: PepSY domain-containing protein, partial [Bacteroidales bacterium]|nr:PepSY domain-containing protein [Bacteroidales bacterium]